MSKEEDQRRIIVAKYLDNQAASYRLIGKQLNIHHSTVSRVIKRFKETQSVERKPGTGKNSNSPNLTLARKVTKYAERKPNASLREIGQKFQISHTWVRKILLSSNLKTYKVQKHANRNDVQALKAKQRARKLHDLHFRDKNQCVIMDDESYVVGDFAQLPGVGFYRAKYRFGVQRQFKYQGLSKYPTKYLVWQAICSCGGRSKMYIAKGMMNSEVYVKECLQKRLLPFIKSHNNPTLFWPDLASCHYSKQTKEWYQQNHVNFVPVEANPPNCPQLRPIERYWALVKSKLRASRKVAKNMISFAKLWASGSKKVNKVVVRRLMAGLKTKIYKFARTAIND